MKQAVIVSGVRTAVGKAPRGTLKDTRPDYLGKLVVEDAIKRLGPNFDKSLVEDVIIGCSFPEGVQGMQVGRIIAQYAGLPDSACGMTVNRFCSSGLQTISMAAERIMLGASDVIVAGGIESMSMVASKQVPIPNQEVLEQWPDLYLGMGLTAENVAKKFSISRQEQDAFAAASYQKANAAINNGVFEGEITPILVKEAVMGPDHKVIVKEKIFKVDEGPREGVTEESLAKLKPAFSPFGVVTAGNSSQTSDGAAAVVVMSEDKAKELGIKPRLRYVSFAVGGCPPGIMGIGPVFAIPKALKLAGLTLKDIGLIELNEAFASQSIYCMRELGLNPKITNVNGGAIALGHPLGCTGTKLTVQIMNEMERRDVRYGMISMCIGGGMGAAGIFELC
ncbi:MAG: acetyl-CoA C-acyltransferase [Firmicutes bacterium]|nr:acetyl-CoA C-acyltransferase [Bacillota bacterium]